MPVSFRDLQEAFDFASAASGGEHQAFLCRQSGTITCHSELVDDLDPLPDDVDDPDKFLPIPDKTELDLGKPLALDFARQFLPGDVDEVRQFFSRRGAYARFKDLLARRGALDHWYAFEASGRGDGLAAVVRGSFDRAHRLILLSCDLPASGASWRCPANSIKPCRYRRNRRASAPQQPEFHPSSPFPLFLGVSLPGMAGVGPRSYAPACAGSRSRLPSPPTREPSPP